jgi:hypothetical protein
MDEDNEEGKEKEGKGCTVCRVELSRDSLSTIRLELDPLEQILTKRAPDG